MIFGKATYAQLPHIPRIPYNILEPDSLQMVVFPTPQAFDANKTPCMPFLSSKDVSLQKCLKPSDQKLVFLNSKYQTTAVRPRYNPRTLKPFAG